MRTRSCTRWRMRLFRPAPLARLRLAHHRRYVLCMPGLRHALGGHTLLSLAVAQRIELDREPPHRLGRERFCGRPREPMQLDAILLLVADENEQPVLREE